MSNGYPWICPDCGQVNHRPPGPGFRASFEWSRCDNCHTRVEIETETRKVVSA